MNEDHADARQRMIVTAARMLALNGLNATSIREMAKNAGAPLGSTYHHFPGGKQQVLSEAVTFAGCQVTASLDHHLRKGVISGLRDFLAMWRHALLRSDFHIGCSVLAVAVEEPIRGEAEEALKAANTAFCQWQNKLARSLEANGHATASAEKIATLIVAAAEGGMALSRASRSIQPFDKISEQLEELLMLYSRRPDDATEKS